MFSRFLECPKGWADRCFATHQPDLPSKSLGGAGEVTEFIDLAPAFGAGGKNSKGSVAKLTKLGTPSIPLHLGNYATRVIITARS